MAGCEGVCLDRVCDFLLGLHCRLCHHTIELLEADLCLNFDPNRISLSKGQRYVHVLLEQRAAPDHLSTFSLKTSASEKMQYSVGFTLAEFVGAKGESELVATLRKRSRIEWHGHAIALSLPSKETLMDSIRQMDVSSCEVFGAIQVPFVCTCKLLDFQSVSDDMYPLDELLFPRDLQIAQRIAIGEVLPKRQWF